MGSLVHLRFQWGVIKKVARFKEPLIPGSCPYCPQSGNYDLKRRFARRKSVPIWRRAFIGYVRLTQSGVK